MRQDICALLRQNSYPGRGILLGRSADNKQAVIAYFIMGRSENSRNRVFEKTEDGIRTRAFDESKMTDPSLINYTPRISGVVKPDGSYSLSILKSLDGDPACCCRYFFEYDAPVAGTGHFISTYQGDGSPLPSFAGEPILVDLSGLSGREPNAALAAQLWDSLNEENKVSLYVRTICIEGGFSESVIYNKLKEGK